MEQKTIFVITFVIITFFIYWTFALYEEFAGSFYVRPKGLSRCDYPGMKDNLTRIQLMRYNRSALMVRINVTIPYDVDNNIYRRLVFCNKGTNGFTWNIVFNHTGRFCDMMNSYIKKHFETLMDRPFVCPFPKGTYYKEFLMPEPICNPYTELMPVFIYGDNKADLSYFYLNRSNLERQFCVWAYGEIRPAYETAGKCDRCNQ